MISFWPWSSLRTRPFLYCNSLEYMLYTGVLRGVWVSPSGTVVGCSCARACRECPLGINIAVKSQGGIRLELSSNDGYM